ncbi:hypothetical protein, partial [Streptomyces sp. UNOC14_S4]|uniref:hypothetical protein n=1 Tax=Streptomyces sp. UNOC14_S4 TaxID=2872340 RepID=UPI001E4CC807
ALRALVFTLPGLGYALAAPLMTGARDGHGLPLGTTGLVASALVAWAWNQGFAHRAYLRIATGRAAAGRCLAWGAPLGALLATAAALAAPRAAGVTSFAAGQALYLAAATVLLVLGREKLLLLTLLPTATGGTALLAVPLPTAVRVGLLLATLTAVTGTALYEIVRARRTGSTDTPPPRLSPLASLPYGLFGLGCGVLTTLAALGDVLRHSPGARTAGAAVIALTLSMGAAEWLLHRCRSLALAALTRATTPRGLLLGGARVLAFCATVYLVSLGALALAAGALWHNGPPLTAVRLAGLLALGTVLWAGLLLQAFGVAWLPATLCLAAAGAEATAGALRVSTPATVQLLVCTGTAAALLAVAAHRLGRITTHR